LTALEQELQQGYHLLHLTTLGQFSQRQQTASLCLADEQNEELPELNELKNKPIRLIRVIRCKGF